MSGRDKKLVAVIGVLFVLAIGIGFVTYEHQQPHQVGQTVNIPVGAFPKSQWMAQHKALMNQQLGSQK